MIHDANDPRLIVDFRLRPGCSKVRMHRRGRRDAYRCDACDEQLDLPSL
jgi:hypothetical protein